MNRPSLVRLLMALGADLNKPDKALWSPCIVASFCGFARVVAVLAEGGARGTLDVMCLSRSDMSAIDYCCEEGHAETARVLLALGAGAARADKRMNTPTMKAAAAGHAHVIRVLAENAGSGPSAAEHNGKLNVNAVDASRKTALDYAKQHGHDDCAKALRLLGARTKPELAQ